jgi:hypothetical protein
MSEKKDTSSDLSSPIPPDGGVPLPLQATKLERVRLGLAVVLAGLILELLLGVLFILIVIIDEPNSVIPLRVFLLGSLLVAAGTAPVGMWLVSSASSTRWSRCWFVLFLLTLAAQLCLLVTIAQAEYHNQKVLEARLKQLIQEKVQGAALREGNWLATKELPEWWPPIQVHALKLYAAALCLPLGWLLLLELAGLACAVGKNRLARRIRFIGFPCAVLFVVAMVFLLGVGVTETTKILGFDGHVILEGGLGAIWSLGLLLAVFVGTMRRAIGRKLAIVQAGRRTS